MKFQELDIDPYIMKGIEDAGFIECTPIQEATLPTALSGRDVAGQSQTGTGKTAAFLLAVFSRLLVSGRERKADGNPRALILAPTRELANQIEKDVLKLGGYTGLRTVAVYGGIDYEKQRDRLKAGVDILVGTPGRFIDYLKQKVISLRNVEILVIDEADRMFDMGFIRDIRFILRRLPPYHKRQSMLFSATLSRRVKELAYEHMNNPEYFYIAPEQLTAERIKQCAYNVSKKEKVSLLLGLMEIEKWDKTVIFTNTKRAGERLAERLTWNGRKCGVITGDIPQKKRMRILDDFKNGDLPFLVATDVASRGLHIDGVTHVVNFDLPQDPEDYVHRIGRTARAGSEGKAISFVCEDYAYHLEDIEKYIKMKIPILWAEDHFFVSEREGEPECRLMKSDVGPVRTGGRKEDHNGKHRRKRRRPRVKREVHR